jgi:hypothetical protein
LELPSIGFHPQYGEEVFCWPGMEMHPWGLGVEISNG